MVQMIHFFSEIFQFASEGNALKAIELTGELAPDLLEKNKDLHFDLLSLHFVELVCSRKWWEGGYMVFSELASMSCVIPLTSIFISVAAKKHWNLLNQNWLLLGRCRSTSKSLKYVPHLAKLYRASFNCNIYVYITKLTVDSGLYCATGLWRARKIPNVSSSKLRVPAACCRKSKSSNSWCVLPLDSLSLSSCSTTVWLASLWISVLLDRFFLILNFHSLKNEMHLFLMLLLYCLTHGNAAHANLPGYSALERLIQQTTVVRQCLSQECSKVWLYILLSLLLLNNLYSSLVSLIYEWVFS